MVIFPDIFTPYIKGRELGIQSNWNDRVKYNDVYGGQMKNRQSQLDLDFSEAMQPGKMAWAREYDQRKQELAVAQFDAMLRNWAAMSNGSMGVPGAGGAGGGDGGPEKAFPLPSGPAAPGTTPGAAAPGAANTFSNPSKNPVGLVARTPDNAQAFGRFLGNAYYDAWNRGAGSLPEAAAQMLMDIQNDPNMTPEQKKYITESIHRAYGVMSRPLPVPVTPRGPQNADWSEVARRMREGAANGQ